MDSIHATSASIEQVAFVLSVVLLGGITLGVGYLTWSDWRDRRRRKQVESGKGRPRKSR
ncbi:hypothetical protein [Synechococcus sp. PCC 7336]|uniref:hypothetical protein n=1 Tax=Synechococcus sp. PCC 7336 TaxID=195250 RepID=UPI000347E7FB|nr:hypothetical protein [Synechococcus sp. PCC 7336]